MHAEAADRTNPMPLRDNRPPFNMMRTSFDGCSQRSRFTCSVVFSVRLAQIHIPNDRATIAADIRLSSHRRVRTSS